MGLQALQQEMEGLEEFRYFLFPIDPHSFGIWSSRREDAGKNAER